MGAISQLFMWYKISESYCVFNGECHEYINNAQNQKKRYRNSNTCHRKASEKLELSI